MHTSIGRLLRCTNPYAYEIYDNIDDNNEAAKASRGDVRRIIADVPHYVADPKILKLAETNGVRQTLQAMAKAGIRHLPFDPIMVEFATDTVNDRKIHNFVRLQSRPMVPVNTEHLSDEKWEPLPVDVYAYIVQFQTDPGDPDNIMIASLPMSMPILIQWGHPEGHPFTVMIQADIHDNRVDDWKARMEWTMHLNVAEAMSIAMMMLNTKGIVQERVEMTKLNKARAKRGGPLRPHISDYTVLRIGHVYDREGRAHSVTGTGRHMPVHWRAGHVRNVPYGPMDAAVRPTRVTFIPPCLVNYVEGPVPQPRKEVTV